MTTLQPYGRHGENDSQPGGRHTETVVEAEVLSKETDENKTRAWDQRTWHARSQQPDLSQLPWPMRLSLKAAKWLSHPLGRLIMLPFALVFFVAMIGIALVLLPLLLLFGRKQLRKGGGFAVFGNFPGGGPFGGRR